VKSPAKPFCNPNLDVVTWSSHFRPSAQLRRLVLDLLPPAAASGAEANDYMSVPFEKFSAVVIQLDICGFTAMSQVSHSKGE
jgi:hypothetical protein